MKWYDTLYLGESIKNARKIKWKLDHNAGVAGVYVIAFASNPANLLDIIPSWELKQKGYPKAKIKVIGLAGGYEEALELVRCIVQETYEHTKDVDVWKYLKEDRRMAQ